MDNRPFILLVLALVVLIAAAIWQFYSLAWGTGATSLSSAPDGTVIAASPR